jgi:hypothetical protein
VSPTTPGCQQTEPYQVAWTTHHELSFSDSLQESTIPKQEESALMTGQSERTDEFFVGVDIAATTAAVATPQAGAQASRSFTVDQTPEG